MPVLQAWPGVWPVAGKDEGFFKTAVALAQKFNLAGFNLDVEPGTDARRSSRATYSAFSLIDEKISRWKI
jgi:hypothetical protein